jgi:hypothetical protein
MNGVRHLLRVLTLTTLTACTTSMQPPSASQAPAVSGSAAVEDIYVLRSLREQRPQWGNTSPVISTDGGVGEPRAPARPQSSQNRFRSLFRTRATLVTRSRQIQRSSIPSGFSGMSSSCVTIGRSYSSVSPTQCGAT